MKTKSWLLIILIALLSLQVEAQTVRVSGRQLLVNGQPYTIKGVCYSTPASDAGYFNQDVNLIKTLNANTIRTYSPINDAAKLDAFANAGIKIVMHLDENNYESYVNTYKNHPAILMWEFGNEFNYHPEWFNGNINNWYAKLQACATRVHQLDTNHPVTTAHGEVPTAAILSACSAVDVWGLNLYRWDNDVPALTDFAVLSGKPMYVSECGGDSFNKSTNQINENQQTDANRNILNGILAKKDICLGACVFEFCDEWWKAGQPDVQNPGGTAPNSSGVPYDGSADEEYWGLVHRDRSLKPSFNDVKAIYFSSPIIEVTGVTMTPTTATLTAIGATMQLTATVAPTNATNKTLTWTSSAPSIATVNGSGLVTAVGLGNVTITATSNNGKTATSAVTVSISGWSKKIEAEAYNASNGGVQTEPCSEGTSNVGWIDANDWMAYNSITFPTTGTYTFEFRVSSPYGATLSADLNAGSIPLGTATIENSGGWQSWRTAKFSTTVNAGTYNLGVFAKTGGWNINWIQITQGLKSASIGIDIEAAELSTPDFSIFPVPAGNELNIQFGNEIANLSVQVADMSGSICLQSQIQNNSTLDISSLTTGVYVIKVVKGDDVITKRFVKK